MSIKRALLLTVIVAAALPATAVEVTNYSWLQVQPQYLGASVGTVDALGNDVLWTEAYHGFSGKPDGFRSGGFVWIPAAAMTGAKPPVKDDDGEVIDDGRGVPYWAAVKLDQPRTVNSVEVQLWAANTQASVSKFYVDALIDGRWQQVGVSPAITGSFEVSTPFPVTFASGIYTQDIRIRFEPSDYQALITAYGGPGVVLINPIGSGELAENRINWANRTFGTSIKSSKDEYNSGQGYTDYGAGIIMRAVAVQHLIDGNLSDYNDDNYRAGVNTGAYGQAASDVWFQLDLGQPRWIDEVVGVWQAQQIGSGFTIQYSTTGLDGDFHTVKADLLLIDGKPVVDSAAMTIYGFDAVYARYWRITEITGSDWCLFEQIMMYGSAPVPEPMTMSLLALGGLALLRRRR